METQTAQTTDSKLKEFFTDQLEDLLWAEKKLVKTLPKMQEAATSAELKDAFGNHLTQTQNHVTRLEQVFSMIGEEVDTTKCAAMAGIVPARILGRATKSEYSAEAYDSLRRHRADLLGLCGDDMRLARLGLVDPAALRAVLEAPPPSSLTLMPLISTFACETWLRAVERDRVPHPSNRVPHS